MEGVCATGIYWVEARDATKHLMMHKTTPDDKELSSPECQQCGGKENPMLLKLKHTKKYQTILIFTHLF